MSSILSSGVPHDKYELVELLGEGSYGAVYKSINKNNNAEVAIKILPAEEDLAKLEFEIEFLCRMRSPYIVSFIEGYNFEGELWIVMEYCEGGSMSDIYEATDKVLPEPVLRAVVAYSVLGLNHLHSHRSIHRDIKAGNILLSSDGTCKLADFGVSAELTNTMQKRRTVIGTPFWMAPEVIQETSYDGRADIWSLGITIIEMCEGQPPHYNVHPMRAIFMIPMKPPPTLKMPSQWSAAMEDFVSRCLVKNPDERATSAELMRHEWVRDDIASIQCGNDLAVTKDFFTANIDAVIRMRNGEDGPDDEKEDDEKDKTIKRDKTTRSTETLRKKRQSRDASLRLVTDTMRTSDSSVFTTNQSGTLRAHDRPGSTVRDGGGNSVVSGTLRQVAAGSQASDGLGNAPDDHSRGPSGVPPPRPPVLSPGDASAGLYKDSHHQASRSRGAVSVAGSRRRPVPPADDDVDEEGSASGTMKFSSTVMLQRDSDGDSVASSDVNAALKYFQRSPALVDTPDEQLDKLLLAIDDVAAEAKEASGAEDLALQELELQLWLLEKQYKEDAEELTRAYIAKQKILETSLKKLRTEMRRSNPQLVRLKQEMNLK